MYRCRQFWIDKLCDAYLQAIDDEHLDQLERLWEIAEQDRELDAAFRGINDALRDERNDAGHTPGAATPSTE